jgi:hypothetical protein
MESMILVLCGIAVPLLAAFAVVWNDERRRSHVKMRIERLAQDNRGLKMALGARSSADPMPASSEADRREINKLADQLGHDGVLLEWLRLGTKAPGEAAAQLLGVGAKDAAQLQQALADWGAPGVIAALGQLKERLASIAEMEMIWADPHAPVERDPSMMLARSMWTFEPEFVVNESNFAVDPRYGAIAKPTAGTGLFPGQVAKDGEPTLVVELKGARITIGADQQLNAWNNVRELIRGGTIRERDPVDVYVVGGAVDELEGNPRIEGRFRNVRITSYDYGHMIARAKRLTFGLYDDLKDHAPFLRQHREDIAAAQQAASKQMAQPPARPAPQAEEDIRRPVEDEPGTLRQPEMAPTPRRGQYEGEKITIGRRKNFAGL